MLSEYTTARPTPAFVLNFGVPKHGLVFQSSPLIGGFNIKKTPLWGVLNFVAFREIQIRGFLLNFSLRFIFKGSLLSVFTIVYTSMNLDWGIAFTITSLGVILLTSSKPMAWISLSPPLYLNKKNTYSRLWPFVGWVSMASL